MRCQRAIEHPTGLGPAQRRPGRAEGGRAGGRRADALVGGPAASLRRSAVGGFEACFVTYIGRAGKSISMPTPIGGGTVVTAEENYHPDVQEHFDRGAAPQARRSAHVHMRRHRRTTVRRAAPVKAGIGQDGGDRSLDRRNCPVPHRARQAGNLAGWLSARAWARPGHHRAGAAIRRGRSHKVGRMLAKPIERSTTTEGDEETADGPILDLSA